MAAINQGKWKDNFCMGFALLGVSIPDFWLALLLIILFSVKLGWLPAMGIGGVKYYILPALAGMPWEESPPLPVRPVPVCWM